MTLDSIYQIRIVLEELPPQQLKSIYFVYIQTVFIFILIPLNDEKYYAIGNLEINTVDTGVRMITSIHLKYIK